MCDIYQQQQYEKKVTEISSAIKNEDYFLWKSVSQGNENEVFKNLISEFKMFIASET